jgi:hypothetical protein
LGSAVSLGEPAAVPGTGQILNALFAQLEVHDPRVPSADHRPLGEEWGKFSDRMPFEAILGEIDAHNSGLVSAFLQELIPEAAASAPNEHHRISAELRRAGLFDFIVTTNLDECLEAVRGAPLTVLTPAPPDKWSWGGQALVKVHGTTSAPATLAATDAGLGVRGGGSPWQGSLIDLLRRRNVLFIGYGFRDFADLTPALAAAGVDGARYHCAYLRGSEPGTLPQGVASLIPTNLFQSGESLLSLLEERYLTPRRRIEEALRVDRATMQSTALRVAESAASQHLSDPGASVPTGPSTIGLATGGELQTASGVPSPSTHDPLRTPSGTSSRGATYAGDGFGELSKSFGS